VPQLQAAMAELSAGTLQTEQISLTKRLMSMGILPKMLGDEHKPP
jgi:hypothetical protein